MRETDAVHTGDLAVIRSFSGKLLDCLAVVVDGEPAPPSSAPVFKSSSPPETSVSEECAASPEASAPGESSAPPAPSYGAASSPYAAVSGGAVFQDSVPVASLAGIFGGEAASAAVFAPDGTERAVGIVCTGDAIVLRDGSGNALRTVSVTVLGDLTRCGGVTQGGCGLLCGYLAGRSTLPPDLLTAADMTRDGTVDTADLLEMKLRLRQGASSGAVSPGAPQ